MTLPGLFYMVLRRLKRWVHYLRLRRDFELWLSDRKTWKKKHNR
jgi:hypothetical protein